MNVKEKIREWGSAGGEVHAEDKKRFSQFYTPNITIMLRMVHKNEN